MYCFGSFNPVESWAEHQACRAIQICLVMLLRVVLYILTSVWVLRTQKAGWNCHFLHFYGKKLKKQEICSKFLQNTGFWKFASKRWPSVSLGIKHSISVLVQSQKNLFFAKFCCTFFTFLLFFSFLPLTMLKKLFDQRLAWAAPKRWLKYTTG